MRRVLFLVCLIVLFCKGAGQAYAGNAGPHRANETAFKHWDQANSKQQGNPGFNNIVYQPKDCLLCEELDEEGAEPKVPPRKFPSTSRYRLAVSPVLLLHDPSDWLKDQRLFNNQLACKYIIQRALRI
ncbi:MAG: hypothetical protein P0Y53_06745 [Candidatus Pseudobacter hemicellulosilyticus]|uniref:Uncharacterized protein n=1 Tax=Candidatus Pseudobacter hemicellulosilyticus TaxID=3121375 RepID=A0AAJ5WV78_9BACT|nr:MAG: hypothetical protein P0Y53_06745 [Pseudobacter sp.]